jgi:hypothetical protein
MGGRGMKGNEEIKGQEGRKCDTCYGRKDAREGNKKGGKYLERA